MYHQLPYRRLQIVVGALIFTSTLLFSASVKANEEASVEEAPVYEFEEAPVYEFEIDQDDYYLYPFDSPRAVGVDPYEPDTHRLQDVINEGLLPIPEGQRQIIYSPNGLTFQEDIATSCPEEDSRILHIQNLRLLGSSDSDRSQLSQYINNQPTENCLARFLYRERVNEKLRATKFQILFDLPN